MASLQGEKEKAAVFAKHPLAFRRRPALLVGQLGRERNRSSRCIEAVTLQTQVEILLMISEHFAACEVSHGMGMRLVHLPSMGHHQQVNNGPMEVAVSRWKQNLLL
jgi:hypothetical protein